MYVLFLRPISILLCLSRKHNRDYSSVNTTQTKTFDLLSVIGISIAAYFSYLEPVLSFCARLPQVMLVVPLAVYWYFPHGLLMQYSLLVWKDPLLYLRVTVHCMNQAYVVWHALMTSFFFLFFSEKHFQVFLSPNHQGFREHSGAENSLRDRL